jgi:hypothetical protein
LIGVCGDQHPARREGEIPVCRYPSERPCLVGVWGMPGSHDPTGLVFVIRKSCRWDQRCQGTHANNSGAFQNLPTIDPPVCHAVLLLPNDRASGFGSD